MIFFINEAGSFGLGENWSVEVSYRISQKVVEAEGVSLNEVEKTHNFRTVNY